MKNSKAAVQERQQNILEYIKRYETADANTLAEYFKVTPTTIRRDLNVLEQRSCINRYFGGARYSASFQEEIAPTNLADEKELVRREIAKAAAGMIEDGDTVFMNSSGTASLVLEYLEDKTVTVITNNARALYLNKSPRTQLILTGGEVYGRKQSLVGSFASDAVAKVTATKCILGVSGISVSAGITSRVLQETTINQMMLERCIGDKIIVAEGSKIGISHSFYSGSIDDITHLITDSAAEPQCLAELRTAGLSVTLAC